MTVAFKDQYIKEQEMNWYLKMNWYLMNQNLKEKVFVELFCQPKLMQLYITYVDIQCKQFWHLIILKISIVYITENIVLKSFVNL